MHISKKVLVTGGSGFIGTNLIDYLLSKKIDVQSIDLNPPQRKQHEQHWTLLDLKNQSDLTKFVKDFSPEVVVHLAARTDLGGKALSDYTDNTVATANLINALKDANFSGTAIFASSMYVCRPGYHPVNDTDFCPHTIYGESKVAMEKIIRSSQMDFSWAIVRPTSIWGPWFKEPYANFFHIVMRGFYFHINTVQTEKTYGYVGNTIHQIMSICANVDLAIGKVIYLGDWPAYKINEWADEIAQISGKRIITIPKFFFRVAAVIGDALNKVGVNFPMTSFRLSNMSTNNVHDLSLVKHLSGHLPYSRLEATSVTISWINRSDK